MNDLSPEQLRGEAEKERAMEALRFDLRWKVALDLPIDHPGFHSTSLVRFRARLLLHGKERLVFERSLELATELGLIEGEAEQIVDSTPMLGAAAVQDTATLVRSAVRRLLDAVEATDGGAAEELASGLRFDYSRPREKPAGDWHDKAAREALLAEVARDAERALRAVEEDDELAADAAIAEAAKLLPASDIRRRLGPAVEAPSVLVLDEGGTILLVKAWSSEAVGRRPGTP
jgi:hypothetical protein